MTARFMPHALVLSGLFVFFASTLRAQDQNQNQIAARHVEVVAVSSRTEDVSSIDGIMKAFYEVVSGPAGEARQWSRDRTLYIPGVRFVSMGVNAKGEPAAHVMDHQQFVDSTDTDLPRKDSLNGKFTARRSGSETSRTYSAPTRAESRKTGR